MNASKEIVSPRKEIPEDICKQSRFSKKWVYKSLEMCHNAVRVTLDETLHIPLIC